MRDFDAENNIICVFLAAKRVDSFEEVDLADFFPNHIVTHFSKTMYQ